MTDKELAIGMYESYVTTKPYAQFQTFVESLKREVNKPLIESIQQGISVILESLKTDYMDVIKHYEKYSPEDVKEAYAKGNKDLLKWWGISKLIFYVDKYGDGKQLTDVQRRTLFEKMSDRWLRDREERGPYYLSYDPKISLPTTFITAFINNYIRPELGATIESRRIAKWLPGSNYKAFITADGTIAQTSVYRPESGVYTRTQPEPENIIRNKKGEIVRILQAGIPEELRNTPPEDLPQYWQLSSKGGAFMKREGASLNVNGGGNTKGDSTMDSNMEKIPSKDIRDRGQSNVSGKLLSLALRMFKQSKPNLTKDEKDFLTDALNNEVNGSPEKMTTIAESHDIEYSKAMALWGRDQSSTGFKGFIYKNKDFIMKYMKELNDNRKNAKPEDTLVDDDLSITDENGERQEAPDDMDESPYDSENTDAFGEMQYSGSGEDNTEEMKREGAYRFED